MEIIFRKKHIRLGILFGTVLFSLFFLASPGTANEDIFSMVQRGDIDGVREFIAEIDNVDIRNADQATLLHIAAWYGFAEIVELLVNASADVNAINHDGWTPLHYALRLPRNEALRIGLLEEKTQIIEFLISNGANVNAQDKNGRTPLMFLAAFFGHVQHYNQIITQILEAFSRSDIDLHVQHIGGKAALSWASSVSNESVVEWLIQNNADVNLRDDMGATALVFAVMEGNERIVRMLIDAGAEVNVYADGMTPLHVATGVTIKNRIGFSEENFLQITMALVEAGADVLAHANLPDLTWFDRLKSRTAYDFALAVDNRRIAVYLRSVMEQRGWRRWHWPFLRIR